jgi:hypothetical protein
MANSWSIIIDQQADGSITFTPDLPGAKTGQPLGVFSGDDVTWNNRSNQTITLQPIPPALPFPFGPISGGGVSNPILNVTGTAGDSIGYFWVRPPPKGRRKKTQSTSPTPDAWIMFLKD